jgi:hypothetical protein
MIALIIIALVVWAALDLIGPKVKAQIRIEKFMDAAAKFRAGQMSEAELRATLEKLGYHGAQLDAELRYLEWSRHHEI